MSGSWLSVTTTAWEPQSPLSQRSLLEGSTPSPNMQHLFEEEGEARQLECHQEEPAKELDHPQEDEADDTDHNADLASQWLAGPSRFSSYDSYIEPRRASIATQDTIRAKSTEGLARRSKRFSLRDRLSETSFNFFRNKSNARHASAQTISTITDSRSSGFSLPFILAGDSLPTQLQDIPAQASHQQHRASASETSFAHAHFVLGLSTMDNAAQPKRTNVRASVDTASRSSTKTHRPGFKHSNAELKAKYWPTAGCCIPTIAVSPPTSPRRKPRIPARPSTRQNQDLQRQETLQLPLSPQRPPRTTGVGDFLT
ncbi:hypothetical protein PYCC9005_004158 [Savitreella phatthalungensis]